MNDDKDAALADSERFLELYYSADYSKERLEAWLTYGPPRDCEEASACRLRGEMRKSSAYHESFRYDPERTPVNRATVLKPS